MTLRLDRFLPRLLPGERRTPMHASARLASRAFAVAAAVALAALSLALYCHLAALPPGERPAGGGFPLALLLATAGLVLALLILEQVRRLALVEGKEHDDLYAGVETLRALLGATGSGVILADPSLRIRLFNPSAEILFGRLADETLSIPIGTLIPELSRPGTADLAPGEDPGRPRARELSGLRAGEPFPLRILLRDLRLDGGDWLLILAEDQSEHEQAEARLEYLEHHDILTGLANRRAIDRALAAAAADPVLGGTPHALCLIDLDRFKIVNDTCGHAAGDKLLQQVARIVSTKLADAACLARLGSDELVALFAGEPADRAQALCEEVIRTLRSFLFTWGDRSFDLTASAGLVRLIPARGTERVLGHADIACQVAKARGGDRLHVYDEEDAANLRRRGDLDLLHVIGSALNEGRLGAIAQPIRALSRPGEPLHYEILVRLRDAQGKPVAADAFIPAAERYILMPAVDRWILAYLLGGQAERLRAWHLDHPGRFLFAVNLSATTLMDEGFLPYLKRQFEDHRVPYSTVCFEVTETAALADLGRAQAFMGDLYELGASFAVDDFGTGFANYNYLKRLPVRYLKIDGSFVRNLERDPVDRALVESINHIGHVLGLETIAEWVETAELAETLRTMGVDYAQGYGVGQPRELDALDRPAFQPD